MQEDQDNVVIVISPYSGLLIWAKETMDALNAAADELSSAFRYLAESLASAANALVQSIHDAVNSVITAPPPNYPEITDRWIVNVTITHQMRIKWYTGGFL